MVTAQDDGIERHGSGSAFCDLPIELLLKIMNCLSKESVWSLRQSSSLFLRIFDTKALYRFHGEPEGKDRHVPFSIDTMTTVEQSEVAKMIRLDRLSQSDLSKRYCDSCIDVLNRGEQDPKLIHLRQSYFCEGCKERHAGIFFSAESIEKYNRSAAKLICIGRLAKMTLCFHDSHEPLTWETIERKIPMHGDSYQVVCTDRSHEPYNKRWGTVQGSALPRLRLSRSLIDDRISIEHGWDAPLLDIDSRDPPSTASLQKTLASLVVDAVHNYRSCKHMSDGGQLQAFARSGICDCFREPGNTRYPETDGYSGERRYRCPCKRQRYLDCTECGAIYAWYLKAGRITLTYRYSWGIWKPTSPGWLGLLDDLRQRDGLFSESSRHLLWCDSPGCTTATGSRWEDMIKEEIWLHYVRYDRELTATRDYYELTSRCDNRECGYRMPPHTLRFAYSKDTMDILHSIKSAAEEHFCKGAK